MTHLPNRRRADGKRERKWQKEDLGWAPVFDETPHAGENPRSLCQYPGCDYYAVTEIKDGTAVDIPFIALCVKHRKEWGKKGVKWTPRRRRRVVA